MKRPDMRCARASGAAFFALFVVMAGARDAEAVCNQTCRLDVARCMATQCQGIGPGACRKHCKPAATRTLAYVVSQCRDDPANMVTGRQELRLRRGDREPVTVAEFGPSPALPDPGRVCEQYGTGARFGSQSVLAFPLQRLGVSPDGSVVVFEVNDRFSLFFNGANAIPPEQLGFFYVGSDGRGIRKLGPPSREPSFGAIFALSPPLAFSPDGRRIAFTDLGPGPGGEDAPQIVVLDLTTETRIPVTHLPDGEAPSTAWGTFFLTCCPVFVDDETIRFQTYVDPDGSNPEHEFASYTVHVDGSGLERIAVPLSVPGGEVVPSFGVAGGRTNLVRVSMPGTPVNPVPPFPITELFLQDGENLVQLTQLRSVDTFPGFVNRSGTRAFFVTSVDPLGKNSHRNCQVFSVNSHGRGLRQITYFNQGADTSADPGCFGGRCSVGEGYYRVILQDPVTKAVVFASSCDPLAANNGNQIFAMRADGSGLRQLTDAAGVSTNPDGSIVVELVGPFAYSAPLH